MNEKLKAFIEKVNEDKELREKYTSCQTPDEAYAVFSSVEKGLTKEEFIAAMEELRSQTEISDDDLTKIAGGIDWDNVISEATKTMACI